ncbi:MAG: Uma2 family endonuclease [Coleofasciculaceae cyanobacterium SM2_1_6]|nr:Uma2 family endonuclease [Coleofasciculaceae cyanobacterium SM2_1_6]
MADYKSEYIDGEILPMAGGSTNHNQIALNISSLFNFAFRKLDYYVYMGDVRLWIPQKRIYTYPDVMVVAGEPEYFPDRQDTILNPILIIEILSDSTERYDRQGKFRSYRTIPSFQEYLLVEQTEIGIEHYYKTNNKQWSLQEYSAEDQTISLKFVDFVLDLEDLYHKTKLTVNSYQ